MKPICFVLAILLLPLVSAAQNTSSYIGYEYQSVLPGKTLPNGVKHNGGGLIGDINADPVYGISQTMKGKTKMLWLEMSTGQNAQGVTGWKVLDVLTFSTLARTRYVFFAGDPAIGCQRKGAPLSNLVGDGRIDRANHRFIPSNLWIANIEKKRFEPISPTGIKCEYSEP